MRMEMIVSFSSPLTKKLLSNQLEDGIQLATAVTSLTTKLKSKMRMQLQRIRPVRLKCSLIQKSPIQKILL